MKCPKDRKEMIRVIIKDKNISYFECPKCHYTIGKPAEEVNNEQKEEGKPTESN